MGLFQKTIPPTSPDTNLIGQTIIVTGASAGLGYEASLQILRLKVTTLILAVRNVPKGNGARDAMLADGEVKRLNPKADVRVMRLDLVDFQSVIDFADRVSKEITSLNVLLLNAGINLAHFEKSPAGNEMCVLNDTLHRALSHGNSVVAILLLGEYHRKANAVKKKEHY